MTRKETSIDVLKALAIVAVIGIHVMAFVEQIDSKRLLWINYIVLDQIFRFCVPLFVAISGFSLAKSYGGRSKVDWVRYGVRRIKKTVPLYLLWSGIFVLVWRIIPAWSTFSATAKWSDVLILGKADYHLYFVPMILSLYILFPLLLFLTKRFREVFVLLCLGLEVLFYVWISKHLDLSWRDVRPFFSDQEQYIFFGSWIFYFVVGIYLAQISGAAKRVLVFVGPIFLVGGMWWAISDAVGLYQAEVDVLSASRFTRLPVLIYSSGLIGSALMFRAYFDRLPTLVNRGLAFVGRQSYWIYLCHTLWLRVIFSYLSRQLTVADLIVPCVIGLGGVIVSFAFERTY